MSATVNGKLFRGVLFAPVSFQKFNDYTKSLLLVLVLGISSISF